MQYATYLVHYGIKDMKWYHRRYQNEDGSLTAEGRERYGVGEPRKGPSVKSHRQAPAYRAGRAIKAIWTSKTEGYLNRAEIKDEPRGEIKKGLSVKDFWSTNASDVDEGEIVDVKNYLKCPHVKDFWSTKASDVDEELSKDANDSIKKGPHVKDFWSAKKDGDQEAMEKAAEENRSKGKEAIEKITNRNFNSVVKDLSDDEIKERTDRANLENNYRQALERDPNAEVHSKTSGMDYISSLSDKDYKRYISSLNDKQLQNVSTRLGTEKRIKDISKTADDISKETAKKAYDKFQGQLSDAKSIASNASTLANNMKNLTSKKATQTTYINPKKLAKMSNEEIAAATERARIVNNYLSTTGQTTEKGRSSIDWDKLAAVGSVVATGIGIASSISSFKNRGRND